MEQNNNTGNAMMALNLYKTGETWMFDDAAYDIKAEPFVLGISEIITDYLPKGKNECTMIFSLNKFPTCDTLSLKEEDSNGGWYEVSDSKSTNLEGRVGWLCPVARVYLKTIPKSIYYKIQN